ncbi:MAG TPA: hypothetical protein VJU59_13100 [Paraburkholderia sp.]|uniref:hypothetical protein n=1 Tax=Paraburkholderia sp. TaxID=1926495 RepID=UPI002B49C0A5|nr:hypothetical protein [Paraburkholderia sp.]HKR40596.1 hypothetical protein [Paraburkholderia sp.]
MSKTTSTLIAAVAALTLSAGAYAQSNNTLATPGVTSPAAAANTTATSGYGTPGATGSDSGMSAASPNSMNDSAAPAPGGPDNNSLARPSVKSPAAK